MGKFFVPQEQSFQKEISAIGAVPFTLQLTEKTKPGSQSFRAHISDDELYYQVQHFRKIKQLI
jgi:hypothetical protein